MSYKNVDLSIVLKDVARKAVIMEVPSIRRAITYNKDGDVFLKTDGININVSLAATIIEFSSKTFKNIFHPFLFIGNVQIYGNFELESSLHESNSCDGANIWYRGRCSSHC